MNALQKNAWWMLTWAILACLAVAVAWPWLDVRAAGFFGLLGFAGFGFLFLRRPGYRAVLDERDQAIAVSARDISMRVVYVFFIAGFVAIMLAFGGGPTIPGKWLNLMVWSGFAVTMLVNSTYTLWQYRKDSHDASPT
jgi:hypothetical protein